MINIKRIYEAFEKNDGFRILIDRLWPRGISKEESQIDLWLKEVAPSNDLRRWYGHDPKKWEDFIYRYKKELDTKKNLLEEIRVLEQTHKVVTLLYGAKDTEHNQAIVLKKVLEMQ